MEPTKFSLWEADVVQNSAFRRVLYTGKNMQVVAMRLRHGWETGWENHPYVEQMFLVVNGQGRIYMDRGSTGSAMDIRPSSLVVVPPGYRHNLRNESRRHDLVLMTVYSPPNHLPGTVHLNPQEAADDVEDEEFGKSVR